MIERMITTLNMVRFDAGGMFRSASDEVITEHRLLVHLDGTPLMSVVLSPCLLEEFLTGFLLTEGFVKSLEDIDSIKISENTAFVSRSVPGHVPLDGAPEIESTGTSRNRAGIQWPEPAATAEPRPLVDSGTIIRCMKTLDRMPVHGRTGGTHCAVLFSVDGEPVFGCEDIGRHNAVDKAVGGAVRRGADLGNSWLATAGRLPADMVRKPATAGIPVIASLAAATFEGIELGKRAGVTVVGRCKEGRLNCYTHPERIKGYSK